MKKLLFLFIIVPMISFGQPGSVYNSWITNWRSYNQTNVATKTFAHSLTPSNVGNGIGDTIGKYLILLNDSLQAIASTSGSICAAITIGNYCGTGTPIILGNGSDSIIYGAAQIEGFQTGGNYTWAISSSGIGGELSLHDVTTTKSVTFLAQGLTNNETLYAPVLTTTGYSNNAIVTAKTPLVTTWTNGTNQVIITPSTATIAGSSASNTFTIDPLEYVVSDGTNTTTLSSTSIGITDATNAFILTKFQWNWVDGSGNSNQGSPIGWTVSNPFTGYIKGTIDSLTFNNGTYSQNIVPFGEIPTDNRTIKMIDASGYIPVVVADSNYSAQTASMPYVNEYSFSGTHNFNIGSYVDITATGVSSVLAINVTFTDIHGTLITYNIENLTGTGFYANSTVTIHAKSTTPIIVSSILTISTMTYDIGVTITQIN